MALDTNWRENGGVFVCARSGNDASGDGSKASPYKTISKGLTIGSIRARAGYYNEAGDSSLSNLNILGDGQVIWDGNGFVPSGMNRCILNRITLINHLDFRANQNVGHGISKCKVINCSISTPRLSINNSLLKDVTAYLGDPSIKNTVVNTTLGNIKSSIVSFYDAFSATSGSSTQFTDCAFEDDGTNGTIISGTRITQITLDGATLTIGNSYMPNERFSGTIGGITFTNCFYTDDPMFNDAANEDYTLQSNLSPLFNNGNIIGRYGVADKFDLSHPAFQTSNGATYTNISGLNANGDPVGGGTPLGIASGTDARFSTSNDPNQCFTLSDTITITDPVQWFGQFIYDNSGNGKWIDTANYNELNNPEVRLTYGIQFYDENEPNANTLDNWSKTYQMEVNMPIERDGSASGGLGNGNVNADLQNLGAITFKRFRLVDVTLRNNGV